MFGLKKGKAPIIIKIPKINPKTNKIRYNCFIRKKGGITPP